MDVDAIIDDLHLLCAVCTPGLIVLDGVDIGKELLAIQGRLLELPSGVSG